MIRTDTQQAVCQNCGITSRGQIFTIFAALARREVCVKAATSASCRNVVCYSRTTRTEKTDKTDK